MKKYFISFLLFTILMGNGCQRYVVVKNSDVPPVSKTNRSKFIDYAGITKSLDKGDRIKEITMSRSFAMPSSLVDKKQIIKYFQLGNFYLALYQSGGVKENRELVPQNLEQAGVLYAKNDDKQWEIFFDVMNKEEISINQPYYMWSEGKDKIKLLVHSSTDDKGYVNVKIINSNDAGKKWDIERCLELSSSQFSKMYNDKKNGFLNLFNNYLQNNKDSFIEFVLNTSTGNFEQKIPNMKAGEKDKTAEVEKCNNLILP